MDESSRRSCRLDEWSELVVLVMKTSLSVAHELGLPPEAVLDYAARHLRFHDFACFASAIQGAARAHACCMRRDLIPPADVAYIKTLATCLETSRDVLACVTTMGAVELREHVGAPAQAYEIVETAIQALKEDLQHVFSRGSGCFSNAAVEGASAFARGLAAIMPADDNAEPFERAFAAVMHVRFAAQLHVDVGDAEQFHGHLVVDGLPMPVYQPHEPPGWIHRVKDAVHPDRLHS
jgi:hypothetical protein